MAKGFDPLESVKVTPRAATLPPSPPGSNGTSAVPSSVPSSDRFDATKSHREATARDLAKPATVPTMVDDRLEQLRAAREGTPVAYAEVKPVQVPPTPYVPPPSKRYRVTERKVINTRGSLTTLAKGSIVSEHSHDLESLRQQKVALELIE